MYVHGFVHGPSHFGDHSFTTNMPFKREKIQFSNQIRFWFMHYVIKVYIIMVVGDADAGAFFISLSLFLGQSHSQI